MSCDDIILKLPDYLERHLGPAEAADVYQHLRSCQDCRAEADRQEAVWELLAVDEPAEAPAELARRVLARVRQEDRPEPAELLSFPPWRRWAALAFAAAAALLIVFGALLFQHAPRQGPSLASLSEEERQAVSHLELLEDYDILEHLDILEKLEISGNREEVQNL